MKCNYLKRILDNLFVDKYNCMLCDEEIKEENEYKICDNCMSKLTINDGNNICKKCGKKMKDEADYCITCQSNNFFFDRNRSYFVYKDGAKKLIHMLKFGGRKYIAKYLAIFYAKLYKMYDYHADVIVSVPISKKRYRERGYNQAREIALALSEMIGLPYIDDALIKVKELDAQEKLDAKDRLTAVIGAFRVNNKDAISGKNVLLIDDVLTTGATMSAAAMELKTKCNNVESLTLASPEVTYKIDNGDILYDYHDELISD